MADIIRRIVTEPEALAPPAIYLPRVIARFWPLETLVLLVVSLGLLVGISLKVGLGWGWTAALTASFLLFAYIPVAARLQDWLLEQYLARGWFNRALTMAVAMREGARPGISRALAELDVGLVHLARGANADAVRCFRQIERHRLQTRTRLTVGTYSALAEARADKDNVEVARKLSAAADEALSEAPEDPYLLAAKAEALLGMQDFPQAVALLSRSLDVAPDPRDPSPGERHLLLARAAALAGDTVLARNSYQIAAQLRVDGPFVRAARTELAQLGSHDRESLPTSPR